MGCTTFFVLQFWVPQVDNDYWQEQVTVDGGASWTNLHSWWGNQCDYGYGPCSHFGGGDDITPLLPGTMMAHRWVMNTTDNGITPDPLCAYTSSGITIDDTWFDLSWDTPVEETSWGKIKSFYR